MSYDTRS